MHRGISERIASGMWCYRGLRKLLKSKLLSRKSKTLLYTYRLYDTNNDICMRPNIQYKMSTYTEYNMKNPIFYHIYKLRELNGFGMYGEMIMIS